MKRLHFDFSIAIIFARKKFCIIYFQIKYWLHIVFICHSSELFIFYNCLKYSYFVSCTLFFYVQISFFFIPCSFFQTPYLYMRKFGQIMINVINASNCHLCLILMITYKGHKCLYRILSASLRFIYIFL